MSGGLVKLDSNMVLNRMRWESVSTEPQPKPEYTRDYKGIMCGYDATAVGEDKLDLVVNQKLSLPLDCSIAPYSGYYAALVAANPRLHEVAEVTGTTLVIPGTDRLQPVLHIRALKKFSVADLEYIATIHLLD